MFEVIGDSEVKGMNPFARRQPEETQLMATIGSEIWFIATPEHKDLDRTPIKDPSRYQTSVPLTNNFT